MKKMISGFILGLMTVSPAFSDTVNSKQANALQMGLNGMGAGLITSAVVSGVTITRGIDPTDGSGLSVGLSVLFGLPIISGVGGAGVALGGLDFFGVVTEYFKNLNPQDSKLVLSNYRQLKLMSNLYQRTGLLDENLEAVLASIDCGQCSMVQANKIYQQMVYGAAQLVESGHGQDISRNLELSNLPKQLSEKNEKIISTLIGLESIK